MSDEESLGTAVAEAAEALESAVAPKRDPAPPVESRFMFVDIAGLRAKQLRRGALPRVDTEGAGADDEPGTTRSRKLERIAIAEVQAGLIYYIIPPDTPPEDEAADETADEGTPTGTDAASDEDTQP